MSFSGFSNRKRESVNGMSGADRDAIDIREPVGPRYF